MGIIPWLLMLRMRRNKQEREDRGELDGKQAKRVRLNMSQFIREQNDRRRRRLEASSPFRSSNLFDME